MFFKNVNFYVFELLLTNVVSSTARHCTWLQGLFEGDVCGVLRQRRAPVELQLELVAVLGVNQLHHALMNDVRLHTHAHTDGHARSFTARCPTTYTCT